MKTPSRFNLLSLIAALIAMLLPATMLMLSAQTSHAASASWLPSPLTNDWNTATNWTAGGPPNGPSDTATFDSSDTTGVSPSGNIDVNGIVFNSGADAFTITTTGEAQLFIRGVGITNNSGITQTFTGLINFYFYDSATAGSQTNFTNPGPYSTIFRDSSTAGNGVFTNLAQDVNSYFGRVLFLDSSTAGNGTFTNNGGDLFTHFGGFIEFRHSSTAGNGIFTNHGGTVSGAYGGYIEFNGFSSAGNGTFTNNGGTASGAYGGGTLKIGAPASAGNATLIANGGVTGAPGGRIEFAGIHTASTARVEVFGNGLVDTSNGGATEVTIGSIEGSGHVFPGSNNLTVGYNNLSTTFSGVIEDASNGYNGVFTKIGTGTLTFEGGASNDHIGDGVTLGVVGNSTINLNFTGDPDIIRSLIVGGVAQVPGLYGSAASGAPHQLPQFTGLGKVLAKMVAVSRKTHGAAGDFDINLPFGGAPGVECRSGGANGNYQLVVTFLNPVTFDSASLQLGTGMVSSTTGNGTTIVTVNFTGVTNQQRILVNLSNVNDGTTTENIPIYIGMLIGDTNGDGIVNAGDTTQTRSRSGQITNATNFRSDVNPDGIINSGDQIAVRSRSGTSLP